MTRTRLAVIALGINGLGEFAFDDALQMSRSLNFHIQQRNGNYRVSDDLVAYASVSDGERAAPLAIRGSKLRLLKPGERAEQRLERPQTRWDVLCGLISIYRDGGIVAACNYLSTHDKRDSAALRGLLKVWANECDDEALPREALLIDYELWRGPWAKGRAAFSDASQLDWRKTMQIAIELPNDFVGMQTEQTIAKEMRSAYALALFKAGRVSLAKAAELADLDIYGFMSLCKDERIEVIDTSRDELLHEMQLPSRPSA